MALVTTPWDFGGDHSPVLVLPPAGMIASSFLNINTSEIEWRWEPIADYRRRQIERREEMFAGALGMVGAIHIPGGSGGGWFARILTRLLGREAADLLKNSRNLPVRQVKKC